MGRGQNGRGRRLKDISHALEHPDIEVVVGLAEREHYPRVRPHVADLLRGGLAGDEDCRAVPAEPDRDEVRQAVGADAAQPHDGLG